MEKKEIKYSQTIKRDKSASDYLRDLYPEEGRAENFSREITFQVGEGCTLNCSYCYQKDKSANRVMSFETGKKIVDLLYRMWDENKPGAFINKDTKMIILDFIGGEPMMYVDVMDKIVTYFWQTAIKRRHPWAETFMISIATNGTLHFKPEVQKFIYKYRGHLSYGVSIDGPKEMHDACRVYYDGRGSFDDAYAAQEDYNKNFSASSGTKATIARANLPYLSTLIKYYVEQGYQQIHANYVYEEEWNNEDAALLYKQMEEISDYILSLDFPVEISLFDDRYFTPMEEEDNRNWCWGKGTPILTVDGYKPIEEIQVGDLVYTEDGSIHPVINTMNHFADNVVEIKACGQFPLICTDNHKLFAMPLHHVGWKSKLHYKDFGTYEVKELKPKRDLIEVFTLPIGQIDFNKDIAKLLGRFIGDGWMTKTNGASICCGKDELQELLDLFNSANIICSYCDAGSTYQVYPVKSKNKDNGNYNEYMRLSNLSGKLATGKRIPLECFNWNQESLQALLDGYLSADGHINTQDERAYCSTVSYELANQLLLILRSLGYGPIVYKQLQPNMKMFGHVRNTHTAYQISWSLNHKERFYHKIEDKLFTSHFTQVPASPQKVYNITVDENHSYIAGGLCSSNCGGTGAMVAFDPVGKAYPCIRYMDSSLAGDMPGLVIGDTDGIWDERYKEVTDAMNAVTRRSQSTDECFYCPIASGCSWCFKAGTRILTPSGQKNIEELKIGDLVMSASGLSRKVTNTFRHMATDTRWLKFANGSELYTTDNHPILTLKGEFIPACELRPGTIVQTSYGTTVLIDSVALDEEYEVYNLTIEYDNTFIANGIKVHNCSGWNYQSEGSFNKRSTRICPMHKARSLASVKHFNKLYLKNGDKRTFHRYLPDEEALKIISQEELDILNDLEEQTKKLAPEGYDQRDYRFCSSC